MMLCYKQHIAKACIPSHTTDIVAEVSKACRKYGLQFAVYYSLWDRKEPSFHDKDKTKYIDFMCSQLTELLTNYGEVCELWLDGGWARSVKDWDLPRVYKLVKELQPYCAVGVNHTIETKPGSRKNVLPDSMTIDNCYTFHYFPSDFRYANIAWHRFDEQSSDPTNGSH